MIIKNHKDLAEKIKDKTILQMNSLGKDTAVCLEWLHKYAKPNKVFVLNYEYMAVNNDDKTYLEYQIKRYPEFTFIFAQNPDEMTSIANGVYQSPIDIITDLNKWEHNGFSFKDSTDYYVEKFNCDYVSTGHSKYESVTRATSFYKYGILRDKNIYPIGMMTKKQVVALIKSTKVKLHKCYKYCKNTLDYPSYYKMRNSFIVSSEYKEEVMKTYPLLALDEYRYEVLFNETTMGQEK